MLKLPKFSFLSKKERTRKKRKGNKIKENAALHYMQMRLSRETSFGCNKVNMESKNTECTKKGLCSAWNEKRSSMDERFHVSCEKNKKIIKTLYLFN